MWTKFLKSFRNLQFLFNLTMSSTKTLVFVTVHEAFCVRNVPVAVFLMFVKIVPRAHDDTEMKSV